MGVLLKNGCGVPLDKGGATSWFVRAAKHGYKPAEARLRALATEGVPEDAAAVERLGLAVEGAPSAGGAASGGGL